MLSVFSVISGKLVIGILAGGAVVMSGAGVAAYADVLPAGLQRAAHVAIGAPLPVRSDSTDPTDAPTSLPTDVPTDLPTGTPTAAPVGPNAKGPAAYGLCTAFTHGGLNVSSTAYASLASAANGASNIATYCATIPKPGPKAAHAPDTNNTGDSSHTRVPAPGSTHKPVSEIHP